MGFFQHFQYRNRDSIMKTDKSMPEIIDTAGAAMAEAHRRTQADNSNLMAAGLRSMSDADYKTRFARHLSDIHGEAKARATAPRADGGGKDEGRNPAAGSTAAPPRADGQGSSEAKNPASAKTAPGPRNDGSTHRSTATPAKAPKATQAPPERGVGRIRKQAVGAALDLANPLHVATGMRVRTR